MRVVSCEPQESGGAQNSMRTEGMLGAFAELLNSKAPQSQLFGVGDSGESGKLSRAT